MNQSASAQVQQWQEIVGSLVDSLRFGIVQIVVHEGRVVQIEKTEKMRLDRSDSKASGIFVHQSPGGRH